MNYLTIKDQAELDQFKIDDLRHEYQQWCDTLIAARNLMVKFGPTSVETSTLYADIELKVEELAHNLRQIEGRG